MMTIFNDAGRNPHRLAGTAILAATLTIASAASAQSSTLEEIIVTAQKRSENLQDVPTSVSVIDSEQLTRLHATQLSDYAGYMPGFNVASGGSPGQVSITLRGIAPVGPGAVVGTYIDDTPLGSSSNWARATIFALDLMPYDVERVEVLRGPQGTLYGAGSMGGLLKYVLREPDLTGFEFRVGGEVRSLSQADDPGWGVRAAVNAPLSDTLAFRASVFNQDTPGYVDNVRPGAETEDENALDQTGGRAAVLWRPSDRLSVKLGGFWQRLDSENNGSMSLQLTGFDPPTAAPTLGDLNVTHTLPENFEKTVDFYSATVDWNLGWGSFVSATSYSDMHTRQITDATDIFGTLNPLLTGGAIPAGPNEFTLTLDLEKWTQEFRLASSAEGGIEWLVGAFYTDEKSGNVQESLAYDDDGQLIPAFAPLFAFARVPTDYREIAAFGDVTFKFSDRFDVTAGLRWADNKQSFRQISGGAILPSEDTPGGSDEDVVTYMFSPRFHISDDTMIYGRIASGYRPGGPNALLPGAPPQVEADELVNYEVGIKSLFPEQRAIVNLAAFYIDWKDIQQIQTFGGISALDNAGDAESQGFELESAIYATDGLRLGLTAAYTDATLKSSPPSLDNALGVQLPGVPEWSGAFTMDYSFLMANREANIGGGYRYVGTRQSQVVTNSDNLSYVLPSYEVLDLNADVRFERLTLRLFARNLTDERGYTGGGTFVDGLNMPLRVDVNVLQPRTFGVSMDYVF